MSSQNEQPIEFINRPADMSAIWTFGPFANGPAQNHVTNRRCQDACVDNGGTILLSDGTELMFYDAARFCGPKRSGPSP